MANEYVSALSNYANFSGRATRKEYWMFTLYNLLISIGLMVIGRSAFHSDALYNLYSLAMLIPSIAVGVRRMHDIGRSGWWLLVPIVNLVFACTATVDLESNERPKLSGLALAAGIVLILIPIIGILAAIAIPAYQTYTVKAKMVEVMAVGKQAETSVANYIDKNGLAPTNLNQTDFTGTSKFISDIAVEPVNGDITLTLNFVPLKDKKIILRPFRGTGTTMWSCSGLGIQQQYLPSNCL
ncbi:DUF805 domain-containing protein [Sapientia aquatica]|uniref:DUF805 domain-containing protein n=1 Tax=Sapientia aquatica TaxID=1549640 RepID=A0A4R5W1R1_9BURK|nr:DUF805 domain-containing protein [Sapientia aquatica]TDK66075.1 DUF805 domain-containing protein [Sapientia aquatica]